MAEETKKRAEPPEAPNRSPVLMKKKRINRSEEGKRAKKESDRIRAKSRVNIGSALRRWKALKDEKGLRRDADVALFLLKCYDEGPLVLLKRGELHSAPLSSIGTESERDDDVSSGSFPLDENQEDDDLQQRIQILRSLINQRLSAAAEEIFGLFERTIAEYEEEIDRQRRLLEDVVKPEIQINKADGVQLLVSKEEVPPEQQEWSPSLEQEEPEPPHIKEEQEELWSSQEGEQLQGLEEADITKFPFTPVPVKSEDDEEKAQSSQLHQSQSEENREAEPLASSSTEQMETEADGEDCGGSEPDRNLDPASDLQPTSDGQLLSSHSSEAETEDSEDDWEETREPQTGSDSVTSGNTNKAEGQNFSLSRKLKNMSSCRVKITRVQMLRSLVSQRLTAAVDETFRLFEGGRTKFLCQQQVQQIYAVLP